MIWLLIAGLLVLSVGGVVGLPLFFVAPWFIAKARFQRLAASFGQSPSLGISFHLTAAGTPLEAALRQSKGELRPRLTLTTPVGVAVGTLPRIILRRETWRDRLGKRLRINREIQSGDAGFDSVVYIESDEPDEVVWQLVRDPRARETAQHLMALGFDSLASVDGGLVEATCVNPKRQDLDRTRIELVAGHIAVFARAAAAAARSPVARASARQIRIVVVALALCAVAFAAPSAAGAARRAFLPLSDDLHALAFPAAAGMAALAAPLLARAVRGRSDSFRSFLLILIPLAVWVLPWASLAAFVTANAVLDGGRSTAYRRTILEKIRTTGKDAVTRIVVHGVPGGEARLRLSVDDAFFDLVEEGDPLILTVAPGRFAVPWVRGIQRQQAR